VFGCQEKAVSAEEGGSRTSALAKVPTQGTEGQNRRGQNDDVDEVGYLISIR